MHKKVNAGECSLTHWPTKYKISSKEKGIKRNDPNIFSFRKAKDDSLVQVSQNCKINNKQKGRLISQFNRKPKYFVLGVKYIKLTFQNKVTLKIYIYIIWEAHNWGSNM